MKVAEGKLVFPAASLPEPTADVDEEGQGSQEEDQRSVLSISGEGSDTRKRTQDALADLPEGLRDLAEQAQAGATSNQRQTLTGGTVNKAKPTYVTHRDKVSWFSLFVLTYLDGPCKFSIGGVPVALMLLRAGTSLSLYVEIAPPVSLPMFGALDYPTLPILARVMFRVHGLRCCSRQLVSPFP